MKGAQYGGVSTYSNEMADKICYLIQTQAKGIQTILKENPDLPSFTTVWAWLNKHEYFAEKYNQARAEQADTIADEIIKIAYAPSSSLIASQDKRTQIDALKWIAAKLKPKKYGDKIEANLSHSGTVVIQAAFGRTETTTQITQNHPQDQIDQG